MAEGAEELKAMSAAYAALESLDPRARVRALGWLAGALGVEDVPPATPPPPGRDGPPPPGDGDGNGRGDHVYDLPLPAFIKAHNLEKQSERALAIMAWATKREGAEALTPAQVETYWKKTPLKKAGNLRRDLGTAASQGWLEQPAKGRYKLTGYGESRLSDLRSE